MTERISDTLSTVYSKQSPSNNLTNSKQYTVEQVSNFVENLDKRVYVNAQFKPFYCKAVKWLGFDRVKEIESMVTHDPRINQPSIFCAERIVFSKLKREMYGRQSSGKPPMLIIV
jgi:hypothetical protein